VRQLELQVTADCAVAGTLSVIAEGPTANGGVLQLESVPLTTTSVDAMVHWKTNTSGVASSSLPDNWIGELITLRFLLANSTLFSFVL